MAALFFFLNTKLARKRFISFVAIFVLVVSLGYRLAIISRQMDISHAATLAYVERFTDNTYEDVSQTTGLWGPSNGGLFLDDRMDTLDLVAGTGPYGADSADFNEDGKPDIAVANRDSNNVTIFLGNGDNTFKPGVNYNAGTTSRAVTAVDFDEDGHVDLAVPNEASDNVSVFLGNGDGTFQTKIDYGVGDGPYWIVSDDFNKDGHMDLATANFAGGSISVLLGTGSGAFGSAVQYAAGAGSREVASGDFNKDGNVDLVTSNVNTDTVSVFLGVGDGTFAAKVDYVTGVTPYGVEVADFNNDGNQDLITANYTVSTVSLLLGTASGTFGAKVDFSFASSPSPYPTHVLPADVNGDGKMDMVVSCPGWRSVSVRLGNGAGGFGARSEYGAGTNAVSSIAVDFDLDGDLDLAVPNHISLFSILPGLGNGTFVAEKNYAVGTNPYAVASADFNGDAKLDIVIANVNDDNVSVLRGSGTGVFANRVNYTVGDSPYAVNVADFNEDGYVDIVSTNRLSNTVSILLGNGAGAFGTKVDYVTGTGPFGVQCVDINHDNHIDLLIANADGGSMSVLLGVGNGTFSAKVDYATGASSFSVASADVNGDGNVDVAVTNGVSHAVSIFLGNGDGTLQAKTDYAAGTLARSVAFADFDSDSHVDMVVVNRDAATVSFFRNNGNGTFATKVDYPTGITPTTVIASDMNNDGIPDLVTSNSDSNTISVILGKGDGTFKTRTDYTTPERVVHVLAADFNKDGRMDIAGTNAGAGTFSVFLSGVSLTHSSRYFFSPNESAAMRLVSSKINLDASQQIPVSSVSLDPLVGVPAGTRIEYKVSRDGGATWCLLPEYSDPSHVFVSSTFDFNQSNGCNTAVSLSATANNITAPSGNDLRYRIELTTNHPFNAPVVYRLGVSSFFPPGTAARFVVVGATSDSVSLVWDKVLGADTYRLDRKLASAGDDTYVTVAGSLTMNMYTDTGLDESTGYVYRLYAIEQSTLSTTPAAVSGSTVAPGEAGFGKKESDNYLIFADAFSSGGGTTEGVMYSQAFTLGLQATSENQTSSSYRLDAGLIPKSLGEYIRFSVASPQDIQFGELSSVSTTFASHTFSVATNALTGFVVTYQGASLTNQNSSGYVLTSAGASTPTASTPGTEQFGLNLRANTVPNIGADMSGGVGGGVSAKYNQPNYFAFQSGDVVATGSTFTSDITYTVSYIANVSSSTPSGEYATAIMYSVTGGY